MKKNRVGNHNGPYGKYAFHYAGLKADKYGLFEYEEDMGTPIKTTERIRRYLNKRNLGKINIILR